MAEGKEVLDKVFEKSFWKKAEEIALFSEPLVKVLQMVDGDKSAMGFVYEAMDQGKEAIKLAYGDKRQKYFPLWRIIDERWNKQLHSSVANIGIGKISSRARKRKYRQYQGKYQKISENVIKMKTMLFE
jgi:hypothetical protein